MSLINNNKISMIKFSQLCTHKGESKVGQEQEMAWDPSFLHPHLGHVGAGP